MNYLQQLKSYINQKTENIFCINIRVIPKSANTEIIDLLADGSWKMRVKAVPEHGKANLVIEKFLQKILLVDQAEIIMGKQDRLKVVRISKKASDKSKK